MLVIMKPEALCEQIETVRTKLAAMEVEFTPVRGERQVVFAITGGMGDSEQRTLAASPGLEQVMRVGQPYKMASRAFRPADTVITVGNCRIGGGHKLVIAGPCSVESEQQMMETAKLVKQHGAAMLRGGAYKPRSSPYSFQGAGERGLKILAKARAASGLPFVTEVVNGETFDMVEEYADLIQIGTRNMQNFSLLKRAGKSKKPILLKRGMSATLEEFLMAAEYILAGGNSNIILCERGIRTFDNYTRNTLDISIVPAVKEVCHLPIIVDPSHACGRWSMVEPLAKAAMAVGADGLLIEVHPQPDKALCDGHQSLKPDKFRNLMASVRKIMAAV